MEGSCSESAQQDIQVSVGKDFVIIGGDRVEVSPDGKKVTAYTNDGVETRAASSPAPQGISISADFNTVVLNGATIERAADGHLVISAPGTVIIKPGPANDSAAGERSLAGFKKLPPDRIGYPPEIGAIEGAGKHKGEIYGGILPSDNKPIWFSAAPQLMDHYKAAAWAEGQGGALPTRKQGEYLTTLKGKGGAFTEIFNRGSSFPAGSVWLAESNTIFRNNAWCQRLSDGDQYLDYRITELPVLCVRR